MLRTNVFVSGGGTLFQNVTSNRSFLYYIALIVLAKFFRKKIVILAQGFGPLMGKFYRAMARFILKRVDLITVRDKDSFDEIRKLGVNKPKVYLCGDPSAILKIPKAEIGKSILSLEGIKRGRPLAGIAVRSVPKKSEEKLYKALAEAVDWLAKTCNFSPVFLLFQSPGDMGETSRVINNMQEKTNVIFRICRPDEMLSLICNLDLLIGMRLHSLIFAAMNSVPMLGISYDPKVEAFMKSIEQPYLKAGENINSQNIISSLEKILAAKTETRSFLDKNLKELKDQAALNFKLFFNYFRPRRKLNKSEDR